MRKVITATAIAAALIATPAHAQFYGGGYGYGGYGYGGYGGYYAPTYYYPQTYYVAPQPTRRVIIKKRVRDPVYVEEDFYGY